MIRVSHTPFSMLDKKNNHILETIFTAEDDKDSGNFVDADLDDTDTSKMQDAILCYNQVSKLIEK